MVVASHFYLCLCVSKINVNGVYIIHDISSALGDVSLLDYEEIQVHIVSQFSQILYCLLQNM